MSVFRGKSRWLVALSAAIAAVGIGLAVKWRQHSTTEASPEHSASTVPIPGYSPSRYQSTGPDVSHVGTAVCAKCHPKRHQSYLLTAHSRAFVDLGPGARAADLDPGAQPPDVDF